MTEAAGRRDYLPELDGLRALSVGFVLLVHASYGRLQGGFLGVDIFFVISGYLITRLMMLERAATGRVDLREFYLRRVFRIIPPLLACLILAMLLWTGTLADRLPVAVAVMAFFANFLPAEMLGSLGHTWSLAIEEQFYVVWPIVFILASHRVSKSAAIIAALVIVSAVAIRFAMLAAGYPPVLLYTFTPARTDGLMLGCLLAITETALSARVPQRLLRPLAWACFVAIVATLFFAQRDFMQEVAPAFTLFALLAAALIFTVPRLADGDPLRRAFASPVARYFGRRSYGLYLYHYPIFHAAEAYRQPGNLTNYLLVVAVEVALSLIVTELSWRFLEQPMLRVKKRYSWRRMQITAPTPPRPDFIGRSL
ncbi:acyltransferase [Sphingomonas sp. So64.6b]|uniref:acyltransferase family protein n=1 Tax=Sphingomonas sp. So64.6b TaxID=2997354 RepID=UPI0015FFB18A|nr:acyltransferase [Sphingomonas sp. So64.6b]QNA83234.1 acyltransferase [Sphingomonas sp. So64.6b]